MAKNKQKFMEQVGGGGFLSNPNPNSMFAPEVDQAQEERIKALAAGQSSVNQWGVQQQPIPMFDPSTYKKASDRAKAQAQIDQAQAAAAPQQQKIQEAISNIDQSKLGLVDTTNLPYRQAQAAQKQNEATMATAREAAIREAIRPPTEEEAYKAKLDPALHFLMDAPVADKKYGVRAGAGGDVAGLANELNAYANAGVKFANKAGNNAEQIQRMSGDLARYGVNSLSEIKAYQVPNAMGKGTKDVFYNTRTGAIIPTEFGSSMKGEGGSTYRLMNFNGRVVPVPSWVNTSNAADFAPLVMAASLIAAPYLAGAAASIGGSIMGSAGIAAGTTAATVTQAAVNAGVQGLASGALNAASGGNFGKGFLQGAAGSVVGSVVKAYDPGAFFTQSKDIGNIINKSLAGAGGAAIGAALTGGDVGGGALRGAISGGISGAASSLLPSELEGISGLLGNFISSMVPTGGGGSAGSGGGGGGGGGSGAAQASAGGTSAGTAAASTGSATTTSAATDLSYGQAQQLGVRRGIR